ncbi:DUF732 domain-containing protein [Mycobacterium colombiense]
MAPATLKKTLNVLLATGLGAPMWPWVPHAIADSNDDAYLNAVAAHNIYSIGGPADLLYAGHQVCGFLSPSTSPAMVTDYVVRASVNAGRFYTIYGTEHAPLTNAQASVLVNDAIGTYCPKGDGARYWGVGR